MKPKKKTVYWGKDKKCSYTYCKPTLKFTSQKLTDNMDSKWIKIGMVGVDSGRLVIIDPCYRKMLPEIEEDGIIWKSGIAPMIQYHFPKGHPGLGVSFSTGLGDGIYDVYGKVKKLKNWGLRIVEIKIKFI